MQKVVGARFACMDVNGRERLGTTPGSQIDNPPLGMIVSNLRSLPRLLSLNQLEAAAALDVGRDQAKISNWEKGKSLPRKPVLLGLLARLKEVAQ